MQLWELASPKSTGQASLKFVGQASRLETQQELMLNLEAEFLLPWETCFGSERLQLIGCSPCRFLKVNPFT